MADEKKMRERMRYYDDEFLTAEDFNLDQNYHIENQQNQNKRVYAWGVLCGLEVTTSGSSVAINPGYAIDCLGREIRLLEKYNVTTSNGQSVIIRYQERKSDKEDKRNVEYVQIEPLAEDKIRPGLDIVLSPKEKKEEIKIIARKSMIFADFPMSVPSDQPQKNIADFLTKNGFINLKPETIKIDEAVKIDKEDGKNPIYQKIYKKVSTQDPPISVGFILTETSQNSWFYPNPHILNLPAISCTDDGKLEANRSLHVAGALQAEHLQAEHLHVNSLDVSKASLGMTLTNRTIAECKKTKDSKLEHGSVAYIAGWDDELQLPVVGHDKTSPLGIVVNPDAGDGKVWVVAHGLAECIVKDSVEPGEVLTASGDNIKKGTQTGKIIGKALQKGTYGQKIKIWVNCL